MIRRIGLFATLLLVSAAHGAGAQPWTSHRPDGHAPIGMMGDHTHGAGEMMLSYRYMYMAMDGLHDGSESVAPSDVLSTDGYGFMVSPTKMPMQMHMLGVMWAPADHLTLMGMLPVLRAEMEHVTRSGGEFTTEFWHWRWEDRRALHRGQTRQAATHFAVRRHDPVRID